MSTDFEMVIGLEVHAELATKTKIFCGCSTAFGEKPNTQCCPVCMGMPGALPVLNEKVVYYAISAGLATNCEITPYGKQDRKHYFYPDLAKAYQVSQYDLPLCSGGHLDIETSEGEKCIGITRIHIEEDAGKLVYKPDGGTLIDCNRGGVPLIEIVSEPDMRSSEQARAYLQKLRAILIYLGISDCRMNEGSFRCDVNLSVRPRGEKKLGTRAEIKNLNSFQSVVRAVEYESDRQIKALEKGEPLFQETRRFDQNTGKTYSMRKKESFSDYRYFPDPDLMPISVDETLKTSLMSAIPQLPDKRKKMYIDRYGLSSYDAEQLVAVREIADYFESGAGYTNHTKILANLIISEVFRLLPYESVKIPVSPQNLAGLATLLGEGVINSSVGKQLLNEIWQKDRDPSLMVKERKLSQLSDEKELSSLIDEVIKENLQSVKDYMDGKDKALQALVGRTMAKTQGKGNPSIIKDILFSKIKR